MKLKNIDKCLSTLEAFFNKDMDFYISEKLCDLLTELSIQNDKYHMLMEKFLNQFYNYNETNNTYNIKDTTMYGKALAEKQKIDDLEFTRDKLSIPRNNKITPRELSYLREFFVFE